VTKIGELEQHKLQLATDVRCEEILGISWYVPEDGILHNHCRENLRSYMKNVVFWDVAPCPRKQFS
jgi:hypothetical protein